MERSIQSPPTTTVANALNSNSAKSTGPVDEEDSIPKETVMNTRKNPTVRTHITEGDVTSSVQKVDLSPSDVEKNDKFHKMTKQNYLIEVDEIPKVSQKTRRPSITSCSVSSPSALAIMRRTPDATSATSLASGLTEDHWVNDWSHHSAGSLTSLRSNATNNSTGPTISSINATSSSSVQNSVERRKQKHPLLLQRLHSSSWASMEKGSPPDHHSTARNSRSEQFRHSSWPNKELLRREAIQHQRNYREHNFRLHNDYHNTNLNNIPQSVPEQEPYQRQPSTKTDSKDYLEAKAQHSANEKKSCNEIDQMGKAVSSMSIDSSQHLGQTTDEYPHDIYVEYGQHRPQRHHYGAPRPVSNEHDPNLQYLDERMGFYPPFHRPDRFTPPTNMGPPGHMNHGDNKTEPYQYAERFDRNHEMNCYQREPSNQREVHYPPHYHPRNRHNHYYGSQYRHLDYEYSLYQRQRQYDEAMFNEMDEMMMVRDQYVPRQYAGTLPVTGNDNTYRFDDRGGNDESQYAQPLINHPGVLVQSSSHIRNNHPNSGYGYHDSLDRRQMQYNHRQHRQYDDLCEDHDFSNYPRQEHFVKHNTIKTTDGGVDQENVVRSTSSLTTEPRKNVEQGEFQQQTQRQQQPRHKNKKRVVFTTVSIRSYNRILGDNPSCSKGPSLSIGWIYHVEIDNCPVSKYEDVRMHTRKLNHEMVLSRLEREQMLMELGYSRMAIAEAVRTNIRLKNQRRRTVHNLHFAKVEETVEKMKRKVKSVVRLKRRKDGKKKTAKGTSDNIGVGVVEGSSQTESFSGSGSRHSSTTSQNESLDDLNCTNFGSDAFSDGHKDRAEQASEHLFRQEEHSSSTGTQKSSISSVSASFNRAPE